MTSNTTPLLLQGTPRQRGRTHGEALRPQIYNVVSKWRSILEKRGKEPAAYMRDFFATRNFKPAYQRWTPGVLEEIEGIAEGANQDFDTIFSLQLMDEYWVYDEESAMGKVRTSQPYHCSGLGVFNEGSAPLIAQNMDVPGCYHPDQAVLRIQDPDSDLEFLAFTFAGGIGLNVINNYGVGACVNTLIQLEASTDGLPVTGVLRGLAGCRSGAEAESFLRSVKHASGQNYIVGSPQGVTSFECSANKIETFKPLPTRTWHTNHPVVNDDSERFNRLLEREREKTEETFKNSYERQDYMAREVSNTSQPLTPERVHSILSSHEAPVCKDYRDDEHSITFGCLIMEMSVPPVLRVSFGPGCSNPLNEYHF